MKIGYEIKNASRSAFLVHFPLNWSLSLGSLYY